MTSMPVIDLSNAQLSFGDKPKQVDVLKGINLSIEAGETVGVLGASGAGKTSLLMVMAGLENVTGGTIALADHD
ncbi:MAG: ATP-binding cassette domain-containing protein, partial [Candidatus Puniceispirillum sp.]